MKNWIFSICFLMTCLFAGMAPAMEPFLIMEYESGNQYFLMSYEEAEGSVRVVVRCLYSDKGIKDATPWLTKQGVSASKTKTLKINEFSYQYSADGKQFRRVFDRYFDDKMNKIYETQVDVNKWETSKDKLTSGMTYSAVQGILNGTAPPKKSPPVQQATDEDESEIELPGAKPTPTPEPQKGYPPLIPDPTELDPQNMKAVKFAKIHDYPDDSAKKSEK